MRTMEARLRKIERQERKNADELSKKNYQECKKFSYKCFKSKITYSGKEDNRVYMRIIHLNKDCKYAGIKGTCKVLLFQKDQFGRISVWNELNLIISSISAVWSEIPGEEFKQKWTGILKEIKNLKK